MAKRKAPARKVALPRGKKIPATWVKVSKSGQVTAGVKLSRAKKAAKKARPRKRK